MNYKLLICLLSVFVLSPLRATILDVFSKDSDLGGDEREIPFEKLFKHLPDGPIELISREYMQRNPQFNEAAKTFKVLQGHANPVLSVAWSPDGTKLASGSGDNTIKIWDAVSGSLLQTLQGHMGSVNSVAWSPDGTKLASGSEDKTIIIWDVVGDSLQLSQMLQGHMGSVNSVAWSPDGTKLASGSWDKTIRIWDLYLLGTTDIEKITLEQFLLLKLLYVKRPTYAHTRMKPIDLNVPLHDQLSVGEAQQILSTFSDEARNRIIKRYNIVGYASGGGELSPGHHHSGSADAASSSAGAMDTD